VYTVTTPRIALHALGCKLNQAELQELTIGFESRGFQVVGPRDEADAYLINTCTVTAEADRKVRQWLRMVRRSHPRALVVACGCGVERARAQLEPLADLLVSNREKGTTVGLVASRLEARRVDPQVAEVPRHAGRTRSFVKVQEGCATPCTYCIVPYVRNGEQSLPAEAVLSTVSGRIRDGYKEIILTGTKIGEYYDGRLNLAGLVQQVLLLPGLARLRLSSVQPQELSGELLSLWSDRRLCGHLHLSLQSGSRTVLERMQRQYDPAEYADALTRIRTAVPGVAITTDVIVGFPGESQSEFEESVSFCETAGFARIHIFPYSRRQGTPAAEMPGQVPPRTVRQRVACMEEIASRSRAAYEASWLGRSVQVLWEEETSPGSGVFAGTSGNYLRLLCQSDSPLQNTLEEVIPERVDSHGIWVRR
jgi:threonylcarbamoyladenosine tRNA methylthiotransferase MtaB